MPRKWFPALFVFVALVFAPIDLAYAATAQAATPETQILKRTSEGFREVARKVNPSVVSIRSKVGGGGGGPEGRGMQVPPELEDFFRFFGPQSPMRPNPQPQVGIGSGFVIDTKGHIVTNNHVVEGATEIVVTFSGHSEELKAKVVGVDPRTDLAVIQVQGAKKLPPPLNWSDYNKVEVGDWAIAVGSPFALEESLTVGVVSAKGRDSRGMMGADFVADFLQTDAAINPGNSGGPLCDIDGNVMGVNTAIYSRSGGYMGIGFAITSKVAQEVIASLIGEGKVVRGWLGVMIQPLDEAMAKELGISKGVVIHGVTPDSPAEAAGIQGGDVITEADGKPVEKPTELQQIVAGLKPGKKIDLKVVSYNTKKTRTVSVKIGQLPEKEGKVAGGERGGAEKIGVEVAASRGGKGVVVTGVMPGSVAQANGIEEGDVLLSVNRKAVNSPAAFREAMKGATRFYIEAKREGRQLFFQFTVPN